MLQSDDVKKSGEAYSRVSDVEMSYISRSQRPLRKVSARGGLRGKSWRARFAARRCVGPGNEGYPRTSTHWAKTTQELPPLI